jgi:hypothetical protein
VFQDDGSRAKHGLYTLTRPGHSIRQDVKLDTYLCGCIFFIPVDGDLSVSGLCTLAFPKCRHSWIWKAEINFSGGFVASGAYDR